MRRRNLVLGAVAAGLMPADAVWGQAWPAKPVRLIVPLAAGSTADIVSRTIGEELAKALGQPVVVDNKPGAGGTIAIAELARAAPDGYTIAFASQGTQVFNMALYAKPGYDSLKDVAPVALTGGVSNVMIVPPTDPATSVADIVARAKARPGELTFSSGGAGTSHHMSGVLFGLKTDVKIQHVPYKGAPQGIQAVMAGEVVMGFFNTPTVLGQIRGGKLKALAVTSETRSSLLPDVPTMIEAAVKDYVVNTWTGFIAPRETPAAVVERLNAELNRISALPAVRDKLQAQGIELFPPRPPAALEALTRTDLALWVPIIKASGASAD
jgi:tripartite-type tricarboxylate transporter receptor subunit TctC